MLDVVEQAGVGSVVAPGAISFPPKTQLEPDVLVVPARFPLSSKWHEITEHWLAVEVLSRSSRFYDREFKRDAYLALGVREVWLVDRADKSVEVSRVRGECDTVRDALVWRVPTLDMQVRIELSEVFAGIE
jgi:Uma2 family endonuclease